MYGMNASSLVNRNDFTLNQHRVAKNEPTTGQPRVVEESRNLKGNLEHELRRRVKLVSERLRDTGSDVSVKIDDPTGLLVVRIKDSQGEIVRQIPMQQLLDADTRVEEIVGLLVDKTA